MIYVWVVGMLLAVPEKKWNMFLDLLAWISQ